MFKLASHVVRNGALGPVDAVGWVAKLCLALEVLHRVGASHGRISAKAIQALGPSCNAAGFFLDTGDLLDDVAYHSPERIKGAPHSPEDDTWAAGVLLYLLLTGKLPFPGTSPQQVAARMLAGDPKSLASFDIRSTCLQQVIDGVLSRTVEGRITSIVTLRQWLIACVPACEALSALKLGKPDVSLLTEERTDTQGEQLTDIMSREAVKQKVQEALRQREAARRAAEEAAASSRPGTVNPLARSHASPLPQRSPRTTSQRSPLPAGAPASSGPHSVPSGPTSTASPSARGPMFPPASQPVGTPPSVGRPPSSAARPPSSAARPPAQPPPSAGPAAAPSPPSAARAAARRELALASARDDSVDLLLMKPQRRLRKVVAVVVLGTAIGLGVWLWLDPGRRAQLADVLGAAGPGASSDPHASNTGAASALPSSSAAPSASPSAEPASKKVSACVRSLFPEDTFAHAKPDFEWICQQKNARKGGNAMRAAVVRAGSGEVSQGMREWSELGWYQMAAFVLATGYCCTEPPELETSPAPPSCKLDDSLERFRKAAGDHDEDAIEKTLEDFRRAVVCVVREGEAASYDQRRLPSKTALGVFMRTLDRSQPLFEP